MIDVAEFTAMAEEARAGGLTIHEAEAFALSALLATALHRLPTSEDHYEAEAMRAVEVVQRALMARPTRRRLRQAWETSPMERGPSMRRKGTRGGPKGELPRVDSTHPARNPRPHAR